MALARVLSAVFGVLCVMVTPTAAGAAVDRDTLIDRIAAKADPRVMEVLVTTRSANGRPSFRTIEVPDVAAAKMQIDKVLGAPGVLAVEMNSIVRAASNDPFFSQQWALDPYHLKFDKVQAITQADQAAPRVAIVDSGVQGGHPDLAGRVTSGYNGFSNTTSAAGDSCGHGTHVAGIVAATINNGQGITGLAPRASIVPVKALKWASDGSCSGTTLSVARGIAWAADHAKVINVSIESTSAGCPLLGSCALKEAVNYAVNTRQRAVIAAAGNGNQGASTYPADLPGVVGVAAVQNSGTSPYWTVAGYSDRGSWVDVAAPGSGVLSTVPAGLGRDCPVETSSGYCFMSGTSMASPYAAAAVALGIQHCRWSPATAVSRLQTTASRASKGQSKTNDVGWGFIKPARMLTCA